MTKDKIQHIGSFDGIRGFAVIIVAFYHGSYGLVPGGFIGVDLFFVLSGYLITSLLEHEFFLTGRISLSKFYTRRALRLIPPLIICVLLCNILWPYTQLLPGHVQSMATISSLLYFTDLMSDYVCGNMAHLWSLSVEEHFYLIWPIAMLFFLFRIPMRKRIEVLIVVILMVSLLRVIIYEFENQLIFGMFRIDPYTFTLCRIDAILLGALVFFLTSDARFRDIYLESKGYDVALVVAIGVLFIIFSITVDIMNPYWLSGGFVLTNVLSASAILLAIRNPFHKLLSGKGISWIGKRSYGFYLYHFPIFLALERFRIHHSMTNFLMVSSMRFGASFAFTALSYQYLERPFLRFKELYMGRIGLGK